MKKLFLFVSLLASFTSFAQLPAYAPASGVVSFWSFNGNANDVSGNGNNGTVNGGTTLTTNKLGAGNSAYAFSSAGCASYIQANTNTTAININGAITVSFWAYRSGDGCGSPTILEFGNCPATCTDQLLAYWPNGLDIDIEQNFPSGNYAFDYANTLTNNTWYHIAYTYDGSVARYYLNGLLVGTTVIGSGFQMDGNVTLGSANPSSGGGLNGNLYDIGVWSRALTGCEIYSLYTGDPSSSFAFNPLQDTTYICDAVTLDAGAGYSDYAWNGSLYDPDAETYTTSLPGWNKVTVENSSSCIASDSTFIVIIKPTITQKDTTVCTGSNIALSATGISGASQTLVSQFTLNTDAAHSIVVPTVIGKDYVMSVSGIWSVHLCTDPNNVSDAAYYYQRSPISALPANLDLVQWNGVTIRPDVDTYNASHIYNYTLPPATQTIQTFSFSDPGTYSDNCGALTFQVYQVQKSTATYTWSAIPAATAGLNAADINQQNLTVHPTATTKYYVMVTDGISSCEDSVLITIATADTSITASDPLMLCNNTGNIHLHAGTDASYQWLLNNNPVSGATGKDYTATQTGTYRVAVINVCTDTSRAVTITNYPQPVADFSINKTPQCFNGNSFVFTNTSTISSGTLYYKWSTDDGNYGSTKDFTYSYSNADPAYHVKLIDSSNNGCLDSISKIVTVTPSPAKPVLSAGGAVTFCQGANVVLSSGATTGNQWYKNGAAISGAANQTYTATTTGTYTVISTVTSCASDSSRDTVVTVNPVPPTPVITANGPVAICQGQVAVLISDAGAGNQWYKNGTLVTDSTNQSYTASSAGTYTVISTVSNCPSNQSLGQTVSISQATPTPVITTSGPVSFCGNGTVLMMSSATTGNQWYNGGTPLAGITGQSFGATETGVYTVVATAVNYCASGPSAAVVVNITEPVKDIRYPAINTYVHTPTVLQARDFGEQYTWTPSTGLSDSSIAAPTYSSDQTTDYVIKITSNGGCITYDSVLVIPYRVKGILVPTAFTPNGDGLNDILKAFTIDIKQLNYFRIYNEWGQLVFESNDPAKGWDGFYKGTAAPMGNYVWIAQGIDINGSIVTEHGQTILIR